MKTYQEALNAAWHALARIQQLTNENSARNAGRKPKRLTYSIYRVGAAWMYTRHTKAETQAQYKPRIADFERVGSTTIFID